MRTCCLPPLLALALIAVREASPGPGAPSKSISRRQPGLCFASSSWPAGVAVSVDLGRSLLSDRRYVRAPVASRRAERYVPCAKVVSSGQADFREEDGLGALLREWGVEDARPVLEANGFTSIARVRDVLEPNDLPELGLPLATRKLLARLIKHLADEKKKKEAQAAKATVREILGERSTSAGRNVACEDDGTDGKRKADDDAYNSDAVMSRGQWQPFHRVISDTIEAAGGNFELRAIEEVELDAPVNENALNTSLTAVAEDKEDTPVNVPLSSGRGGRYEASRKRVVAPPPRAMRGEKQKRHFRYCSREGDFFVKVVLTGEPVDTRGADEKEDAVGNMMSLLCEGRPEGQDALDFGAEMDSLVKGLDLAAAGDQALGSGGVSDGLILGVPDDMMEQLVGADVAKADKLEYPHSQYQGEQVSLSNLRSTGQMRVPAPIVAGDLLDEECVANHLDAGFPEADLLSGGFGVLEWVELRREITPVVVSDVAQQLARVHLSSQGMSQDYGFSINTYLGEREQDNSFERHLDVLDFFLSRRLDPEIDAASRSSTPRAARIPAALRDEIGTKGFQAIQRVQESQVWRDLIFSPVREQGPCLLHGDLWLGNMAVDTQRRAYVVGPASWFGPSDYDLAVGETFGMPQRFRQAYEHYCPKLEGSEQRAMLYKLYILLNHLNQPASYKFSSNVRREPLFRYAPDNLLGEKTLTSFRTSSVFNPGKHSYRSEMEMITRGGWFDPVGYARDVTALLDAIIDVSPPKSGSKGKIFKLWGSGDSRPRSDAQAKRIEPPDGLKIIPFGYKDSVRGQQDQKG